MTGIDPPPPPLLDAVSFIPPLPPAPPVDALLDVSPPAAPPEPVVEAPKRLTGAVPIESSEHAGLRRLTPVSRNKAAEMGDVNKPWRRLEGAIIGMSVMIHANGARVIPRLWSFPTLCVGDV
ncbi:MAG: hypothetical protein IPM54_08180 [Polyangiaceae bacterium]|nr:hypothetical protein [Polyangiaceae bacterium]